MDTLLVVNAGSSSVKFQVFGAEAGVEPRRLIKGQVDGVGTRPRLRAEAADKAQLVDESYDPDQVKDVPAALERAGTWLRTTQNVEPIAAGHRVVHGGPRYDRAIVIDDEVLAHLEHYAPLAPLPRCATITRPVASCGTACGRRLAMYS